MSECSLQIVTGRFELRAQKNRCRLLSVPELKWIVTENAEKIAHKSKCTDSTDLWRLAFEAVEYTIFPSYAKIEKLTGQDTMQKTNPHAPRLTTGGTLTLFSDPSNSPSRSITSSRALEDSNTLMKNRKSKNGTTENSGEVPLCGRQ